MPLRSPTGQALPGCCAPNYGSCGKPPIYAFHEHSGSRAGSCSTVISFRTCFEAALTFLGFGLSPSQPAIGVLLAEAMRYLNGGYWWLGVFPGLGLLLMVLTFERLSSQLRRAL